MQEGLHRARAAVTLLHDEHIWPQYDGEPRHTRQHRYYISSFAELDVRDPPFLFPKASVAGVKVIHASDGKEGRDMHALNEASSSHCTVIQGTSREREIEKGRERGEEKKERKNHFGSGNL